MGHDLLASVLARPGVTDHIARRLLPRCAPGGKISLIHGQRLFVNRSEILHEMFQLIKEAVGIFVEYRVPGIVYRHETRARMITRQDGRLFLAPGKIPLALKDQRLKRASLECARQVHPVSAAAHGAVEIALINPFIPCDRSYLSGCWPVEELAFPVTVNKIVEYNGSYQLIAGPIVFLAHLDNLLLN